MHNAQTFARTAASLAAALILACAMLAFASATAQARALDTLESLPGTHHVFYHPKEQGLNVMEAGYSQDSHKATKVKSSNPAVVSVKRIHQGKMLRITAKKAGSAKVTYTYKGKNRTVKYVVAKYVNPVKSFKVGGKEFKRQFDAHELGDAWNNPTGTLKVKAAKGWKLVKLESDAFSKSLESLKTKTVNNGYKVKDGRDVSIRATLKNKKTGVEETVQLDLAHAVCLS